MTLTPGQSLSIYEMLGPRGARGMGEVYRARDTRLERRASGAPFLGRNLIQQATNELHSFGSETSTLIIAQPKFLALGLLRQVSILFD